MNPHRKVIFWFLTTLPLVISCNFPSIHFLTSGTQQAAHSQLCLSALYLSVPFLCKLNFCFPLLFFSLSFSMLCIFCPSHSYPPIIVNIFAEDVASKTVTEVDRVWIVHFMEAKETTKFCAHFNIGGLHVKQFLKCFVSSNTFSAKKGQVVRAKVGAFLKSLHLAIFASFPNLNF